jgi:2-dehydropantoate 2-reductase
VVSLQNGLGDEEQLASLFGAGRVLGGLCFVCLNRVEPGVVRHSAHGLVVLGEHLRPPGTRTNRLATMLRDAGIPCRVTEDLARAHWEKLVWNVPFNGLGVAGVAGYGAVISGMIPPEWAPGPTLTTDRLLAEPRWEQLVRELMQEVVAAARGQGYSVAWEVVEEQIARTRVMGAYRASTLVDWEAGRPLEIGSVFEEPRRRAECAGVVVDRLSTLCKVLRELERRREEGWNASRAGLGLGR